MTSFLQRFTAVSNVARYGKVTALAAACASLWLAQPAIAMDAMSEDEMAKAAGQANFLTMKNIGPNDFANPNPNVGFTRVTLNSRIDINSNMRKLRLGCENANLTNCDISIDNLALTGIVPAERVDGQANNFPEYGGITAKLNSTKALNSQFRIPKNKAAATDFVMDNPFIELAIQNPESLTNRKMVGYRFGAHEVWGMMGTGSGPTRADGTAPNPKLYGPTCNASGCNENNLKFYGTGVSGLNAMYDEIVKTTGANQLIGDGCSLFDGSCNGNRQARFDNFLKPWLSRSIAGTTPLNSPEDRHTGVNQISGRMPVRLDNFNLQVRVREALLGLTADPETAIVSGGLDRVQPSSFGRTQGGNADTNGSYEQGYLRNVFLGDTDTNYDVGTWGQYLANNNQVGRAPVFKRASQANLKGMIVHIHKAPLNALTGGDRFNDQLIDTSLFHSLQFGKGTTYEPGKGSKHMAFQFQTLDGLQWITTDQRISTSYDLDGNPTGTPTGPYGGYDWLSTRAGWWLESPMATVKNAFVPAGNIVNRGAPGANDTIKLFNVDLGTRAADNCYGQLTFC